MKRFLAALLFPLAVSAQETNLSIPTNIGPVSIKQDIDSLSAIDWLNAGQSLTTALRFDVIKPNSAGSEPFFIRPYPYGLSLEYAGIAEWMVDSFSVRHNFRYTHLKPKTFGDGPQLVVGDRLDTGGLFIQSTGSLRVDGSNNYVFDPETGQPYLDNKAIEIVARTFRGNAEAGLDAGDIHFITRGPTRLFKFKGGPKNAETVYSTIGPDGITIGPYNVMDLIAGLGAQIAQLKARIDAMEQANN